MNKALSAFIMSLAFNLAHAETKPCGGAQVGYWTNPDGSRGGMVAKTARAFKGAIIALDAQVCESAQIHKEAKLLDHAVLTGRAQLLAGGEVSGSARVEGEAKVGGSTNVPTKVSGDVVIAGNPQITGRTSISQKAKVSGSAKIHNSVICQASLIEGFDVNDSDYYCQTDDPEPSHPGVGGSKTLLGVDSDRDGVRDDVEIWINQKLSNTPAKNMKKMRLEFKLYAAKTLEMMKFHKSIDHHIDKILELWHETEDSILCIEDKIPESEDVLKEFQAQLLNTTERSNAYQKVQGNKYLAGKQSDLRYMEGYKACTF